MPERGGPTTQAGIFYQNTVAALYLGRLLDAQPQSDRERVTAVRVEAPSEVDDTVVEFADGHCAFIQAKITIHEGDAAWDTLWKHIARQFISGEFRRGFDRLHLQFGSLMGAVENLPEICERANSSVSYTEWQARLSRAQQELLTRIQPLLQLETTDLGIILDLFKDIEVEIASQIHLDRDQVRYWVPSSNVPPQALFKFLRDRVAGESRIRSRFTEEE